MVEWLVNVISWLFIAVACALVISAAVGLIRMPDFYSRLHAASLTDTGVAMFLSVALVLQAVFIFDNPMAAIKVVLILVFLLLTAPTASHALAKTALLCGHVPTDKQGHPVLESPEEASKIARSRPADYRHGQDAEKIERQLKNIYQSNLGPDSKSDEEER